MANCTGFAAAACVILWIGFILCATAQGSDWWGSWDPGEYYYYHILQNPV